MRVVDHEPHAWFLFQEGDDLLLDVNCSHRAVGYSVLIPLGLDEVAAYARHGRPFLNQIAHDIQNAGPGSVLQRRDVSAEFAQVCSAAIQEWIERDIGAT